MRAHSNCSDFILYSKILKSLILLPAKLKSVHTWRPVKVWLSKQLVGYHGRIFWDESQISVLEEQQLFSKVPKWYKKNSLKNLQTTAYKHPPEACKFKLQKVEVQISHLVAYTKVFWICKSFPPTTVLRSTSMSYSWHCFPLFRIWHYSQLLKTSWKVVIQTQPDRLKIFCWLSFIIVIICIFRIKDTVPWYCSF